MEKTFRSIALAVQLKNQTWRTVEAIERIGTGLAIYNDGVEGNEASYGILHLASGLRVSPYRVATLIQAGTWIRLLLALTNWTQDKQALLGKSALPSLIEMARRQAIG